jgi:translation elongation factor P/translation initiation factor 5A
MIEGMRGRPWTNIDRTGGPIDEVFSQLREQVPGVIIERLEVTHPADDDNVYFIGDQHQFDRVQVDTYPDGQPSFLIENENGLRHETTDTTEAVTLIRDWLEQN